MAAGADGVEAISDVVVGDELVVLIGEGVQPVDAARHGVASGVVAPDDEQQQVAQVVGHREVSGRFAVHEHGDQIATRRLLLSPLFPDIIEVLPAVPQLLESLLRCLEHFRIGNVLHRV